MNYRIDKSKILLWGHSAAFLIALLLSLQYDRDEGIMLVFGFVAAYAIPALLCKWLTDNYSRRIAMVLLCSAVVLMIGITLNLNTYLSGDGTFQSPAVTADALRDINAARNLAAGIMTEDVAMGYPIVIHTMFSLLGINVIWPMLLSMVSILCTIVVAGKIASTLTLSDNKERASFRAMLLTASVAHLMLMGTIVMKDAHVALGMALCGYALAKCYRGRLGTSGIVAGACGAAVLMLLKGPMGWFVLAGVVMICLRKEKGSISDCIYLALLCVAMIAGGNEFRGSLGFSTIVPENSDIIHDSMHRLPSLTKYVAIIPDYYELPLWRRILLLPLTATVQYFPPFPWNFTRDLYFGGFYWWPHLSFFWYAIGGMMLGFYLFQFCRKSGAGFSRWALWWGACYLGVALVSAGTVPRYYIPMIPLGIPLALHFFDSVKSGIISRRNTKIYVAIYLIALCTALIASFIFLKT